MGCRGLDLRYGAEDKDSSEIVDMHGPLSGKDFFVNFNQLKEFLEENPKEFVIVKIQAESNLTDS